MSHSQRFLEVSRSIGGGACQLSRRDFINEGGVVVTDPTKELGSVLTLPSVDDDHLVYRVTVAQSLEEQATISTSELLVELPSFLPSLPSGFPSPSLQVWRLQI